MLEVIKQRVAEQPEGSYTVDLIKSGPGRVAQKVVEEAGEVAIAAVSQTEDDLANEMADLLYHNMVLLAALDVSPDRIWEVLAKRRK
ncbi:MAG: phosphoribosyl-ATP diphosphatase [Chloroflexota bacterium]